MRIDRRLAPFTIDASCSVAVAMEALNRGKRQILFAVDADGLLQGALTDGDLRRAVLARGHLDVTEPLAPFINRQCVRARASATHAELAQLLSGRIEYVPLLDSEGRLVCVASLDTPRIDLGSFSLHDESRGLVIAEIGNNHNGSLEVAKALVDAAHAAGADSVKFQLRHLPTLYANGGDADDPAEDLSSQYVLSLLKRYQLGNEALFAAMDYARQLGLVPLCTPFDETSFRTLASGGAVGYKVASADLVNHDFLRLIASDGKPMICSTGMSTEQEIVDAVAVLRDVGADFALLHCNSTYPAPFADIQLHYLRRLQELGGCLVGYSGHERGIGVSVAAVALGAKIVERHITLDKAQHGNDHKASLLPDEFAQMVTEIRAVEAALGSRAYVRRLSQGALLNRETLGKSLAASRTVRAGESIAESDLSVVSPGKGLAPYRKAEVVGKTAIRDLQPGTLLYETDVTGQRVETAQFALPLRFGIPVRFHDALALARLANFSLLEFHLSANDVALRPADFFDASFDGLDLVVHAPEQYTDDFVLDLCALDAAVRGESIRRLREVLRLAAELREFVTGDRPVLVITNVGGASTAGFDSAAVRADKHARLLRSVAELGVPAGIELLPQTMPPLPWLFGGQQYHNVLVEAADIEQFCRESGSRVCLDVAHSKMACNHADVPFASFLDRVLPWTAHLHVADCTGVSAEGLQIGDGEVDFGDLLVRATRACPHASWIPEVWQGHKDGGQGFMVALQRLEAAWQRATSTDA